MITKGIIEKVIDKYSAKVRIPIYDGIKNVKDSTSSKDLSNAFICSLPNTISYLKENDIVYVAFEDDDIGKPVILGYLQKETGNTSKVGLNIATFTTTSTTNLNEQTSIGDIKPSEIKMLSGAKDNLQAQIDLLRQSGDTIELNNKINDLNNKVEEYKKLKYLPIGTIIASALVQDDSSLHLLNGDSLLKDGIYSDFVNWIINKNTTNPNSIPTCSIEEYASDMINYQQCGKFVINNTSNVLTNNGYSVQAYSIKLPTITRIIQGLSDISTIGDMIQAGLPNITGYIRQHAGEGASIFYTSSGAIFGSEGSSNQYKNVNDISNLSGASSSGVINLDASRSSSIYGKSTTVQPITTRYPYYIVVATGIETQLNVDINNIVTELNNLTTAQNKFSGAITISGGVSLPFSLVSLGSVTGNTTGRPLVVQVSICASVSTNMGFIDIFVDGVNKGEVLAFDYRSGIGFKSGLLIVYDIPAGTHTLDIRAHKQNTNVEFNIYSYNSNNCIIFEV